MRGTVFYGFDEKRESFNRENSKHYSHESRSLKVMTHWKAFFRKQLSKVTFQLHVCHENFHNFSSFEINFHD